MYPAAPFDNPKENLENLRVLTDMHYVDISSIALQGLQQAQSQFDSSAQRLASIGSQTPDGANVDTVSLSTEAVSMLAAKNQFAANINVLKVADEMQKSVVNLLA